MKKVLTNLLFIVSLTTSSFAMMMDDPLLYNVTVDQLEKQNNDDKTTNWDIYAWIGYDLHKVYLYSEGEKPNGAKSESEHQIVYSRAFTPFWDIQVGAGHDTSEDSEHDWAVIALSGLAPYFFETRAALLIGEDGNIGIRLETEYEALLTQKLILSPSLSTSIYSKNTPNIELGKGVSDLTIGLRLRYELIREFAPYIGIEWMKNFGKTKEYHHIDETFTTVGVRFWF